MRVPETETAPPVREPGEAAKHETVAGLKGDYSTTPPLTVTQFPDEFARKKSAEWSTDWPGFVEWLDGLPRCRSKEQAQWVKLATFGDTRTDKNCLRHNANMVSIGGVEGDYDGEAVTPDQAVGMLESHNLRAVIVTTYSHAPDAPRWRVFAPLSKAHTPDARKRLVAGLNGALGGILTNESFTQSQGFYVGGPEGGEYKVLHTFRDPEDGIPLDDWDDLDLHATYKGSGEGGNNPGEGASEWLENITHGEQINPSACSEVARLVRLGLKDDEIRLFMEAALERAMEYRDPERIRTYFNGEFQRQLDGARGKGYAPGPEPDISGITGDEPAKTQDTLPPFPDDLVTLPHGLGEIQDWIYGRMKYPSWPTAGFIALATLTACAQSHITVDSMGGLGLNEQYMGWAPTGRGKEDWRSPPTALARAVHSEFQVYGSRFQWAAPSSQQGLHKLMEDCPAQMFLSDEFAEWLAQTGSDPHKQATLGYFMQLYTKALTTVNVPAAVTNQYSPVKSPRVSVLATTTADRILESMTESHARSGAYNRWVIFPAEEERIEKRYEGFRFEPPDSVVDLVRKILGYGETLVTFSREAWAFFKQHDSTVIEPLKIEDDHLAGRLSEQAIKIAALIALSDYRVEICEQDLRQAYSVREGLYHRARAKVSQEGAISGMHTTGQAVEQVRGVLRRRKSVYKSRLPSLSRKYKGLSVPERHAVLAALYESGEVADVKDHKGLLVSQICET